MKPPTISGPRRKSRGNSPKDDPIVPAVAATGLSNGNAVTDVHARIAAVAYDLYEQRGRQDGHDVDDWLKAEMRVLDGMS